MRANHMDKEMNKFGELVGAAAVAVALFGATPAFAADLANGR